MAQSKAQKDLQAKVEQRLTSDAPLTVNATASVAGKKGESTGRTRQLLEQHPSLESVTTAMSDADLQSGTVTTNSGLEVQYSRSNRNKTKYNPQAPELGNKKASPLRETGGTPMLRTQVGPAHGAEAAAKIAAEAETMRTNLGTKAVSNTVIGGLAALHAPTEGNAHVVEPGVRSRVAGLDNVRFAQSTAAQRPSTMQGLNPLEGGRAARRAGVSMRPVFESSHEMVAHGLGYTEGVQAQMLQTARGIAAQRGRRTGQTSAQREAAAQGMVQEHIDTAIRGTKNTGMSESERARASVVNELNKGESRGVGIKTEGPNLGAVGADTGRRELGNTPTATPTQKAARGMRKSLRQVTENVSGSSSIPGHIEDVARDHEAVMRREATARRRAAPAPQDRSTMGTGSNAAQNQSRSRGEAQFVVSNAPHMDQREQARMEGIAGELENQGQADAAKRVRSIVADRSRSRPGVGVVPEMGKKGSVVTRRPYAGEESRPQAGSNIANPSPPRSANTPKTVPQPAPTPQRQSRRPVGGGTTESALANARAEVAKRAGK